MQNDQRLARHGKPCRDGDDSRRQRRDDAQDPHRRPQNRQQKRDYRNQSAQRQRCGLMQVACIQPVRLRLHVNKHDVWQIQRRQGPANSVGVDAGTLRRGQWQQSAPLRALLNQQGLHRHGHGGVVQVCRLQQWLRACRSRVAKKRAKQRGRNRQPLHRQGKVGPQQFRGRKAGLPGAL